MKKTYKVLIVVLVCILLIVLVLFLLTNKKSETTDINDYLKYHSWVETMLEEELNGSLPSKEIVNSADVDTYLYRYNNGGLLGDRTFIIDLKCKYNEKDYSAEKTRIESLSSKMVNADSKQLYLINYPSNIDYFSDDEIYDGLAFVFEIVIVDDKNQSIEYLSSLQQDNMYKEDIVKELVSSISQADR